MQHDIKSALLDSAAVKTLMAVQNTESIEKFANIIIDALKKGNKVIVCGNGGSAADAQHFAAEFIVKYKNDRRTLPAIALTTNSSVLTAHANDFSFDTIYERQVEALAREGDVFVGISTSGNSQNVLLGLKKAKWLKCRTIALLGRDGGKTKGVADLDIIVPSNVTARIQEGQMCLLHIVCQLVDKHIFGV